MPHFFITTNALTPNPGRLTRQRASEVCSRHHGKLAHFWHDDPANPQTAYILVEDGDLDGLLQDLHAHHIVTLHPAS